MFKKTSGAPTKRTTGRKWMAIRARILKLEPLCKHCLERGIFTPSTVVDHIKPLFKGGTDERSNLQGLCVPCHDRKTKEDTHGIKRGHKKEQTFLDGYH